MSERDSTDPGGQFSPDGHYQWLDGRWVPVRQQDSNRLGPGDSLVSPDGRFLWNGQAWVPRADGSVPAGLGVRSAERRNNWRTWLGLVAALMGLLLSFTLWSRPMLFIGVTDVAMPLLLAVAGILLVRESRRIIQAIAVLLAIVAIGSSVLVMLGLIFG